jgi:5-hydroxyisourate hydrolase-like protein (transthyretin family)
MKQNNLSIKREGNIVSLTTHCLVEDLLFNLKEEVKKGEILFFRDENKRELIDQIYGNHNSVVMTHRLEEKDGKEGIAEMSYFVGDCFNTTRDYWYAKEDYPKKYNELKEIEAGK